MQSSAARQGLGDSDDGSGLVWADDHRAAQALIDADIEAERAIMRDNRDL